MRAGIAGAVVGLAFGATLSWSGLTAPDVIRGALLFEDGYLYLVFASAVLVATAGSWALRRAGARALLTGQAIGWTAQPPARRHIAGSLLFGLGWGVADACPGPIAAQLGQGVLWSLFTVAGVVIGIRAFMRRHAVETEPAVEAPGNEAQRLAPAQS